MANTPAIRSKQAARATLKGSRSLLCAGNLLTFIPSRSFSSIFCVTDLVTRSTWSVLSSCRCLSLSWPNDLYTSSYRLREDGTHELMTDVLRFVFIELGRFKKRLWELESVLDKWLYLFKHIHELTSIPDEFQIPTPVSFVRNR